MPLKLRQEIEIWYIVPAIRKEIAKGLVKRGLKQRAVAQKLEITDAAVSQYFTSKRGSEVKFNKKIKKGIEASIDRLMKGSNVMKEIQSICKMAHRDGICCYIHKHHGAPKDCNVCFPERGG